MRRSARTGAAAAALLACGAFAAGAAQAQAGGAAAPPTPRGVGPAFDPPGPARDLPRLDTGLPTASPPVDLGSPRAALYNLTESCERGDLTRAARSLDTRMLGEGAAPTRVAERLCYLLDRRVDVDWSAVSDHPEGLDEGAAYSGEPARSRHNVRVGSLPLEGRPVDLRLQRVRPPDRPPMWLVAGPTVAQVDALYQAQGPSWFEQDLPKALREEVGFGFTAWEVLFLPLLAALAFLGVWLPTQAIRRALRHSPSRRAARWVGRVQAPLVLLAAALVFRVALTDWLGLRGHLVSLLSRWSVLVATVAIGWLAMRIVDGVSQRVVRRYSETAEDDQAQDARRTLTLNSVARRVVMFLVFVLVVGVILRQLDLASAVGSALLGTAGAITVVIAVAAHRVLGNLLTGVQMAITKPLRIGDSVVFEGNWGRVEQIHYTHVTVRTWDDRRLVVPFQYLLEHTFENWSSVSARLVKPIYLNVDFSADVDAIRRFFVDTCRSLPASDPDYAPQVLVTELKERSVVVRCTCGARTPSDAWYLHCYLREQLLGWLQRNGGDRTWPREREQHAPGDGQEPSARAQATAASARRAAAT